VVFTRDLRIRDNPALAAAGTADRVVPAFVLDDALLAGSGPAANRLGYLADALADLDASLRRLGGALVVRRGNWIDEIVRLVVCTGATVVHVSDDVSRTAQRRLDGLRAAGERDRFAVVRHPGVTIVPPEQLRTGAGAAYQVFTPFHRRWIGADWREPVAPPRALTLPAGLDPGRLPTRADLTAASRSPRVVRGGENAALERLRRWAAERLEHYAELHDAIAADATSHASADLHFGCLSPLEVATHLRDRPGGDAFVRQLCWRDFFHQLLAARPESAVADLRTRRVLPGETVPSGGIVPSPGDDEAFEAWRAGRTGYPLVDAGMRQLQAEGFVHNRVRMVVASFLTKDLGIAWQMGARHFMDLLVDGDVANNQLNWQWVAGTGTDTNRHRVFNPTRQSERFDPEGVYIRRYVHELADVASDVYVHDPPDAERRRLGYAFPLVDHRAAVAAYRARRDYEGAVGESARA
jgi:deoxyribodipyrimidine photo-lyase